MHRIFTYEQAQSLMPDVLKRTDEAQQKLEAMGIGPDLSVEELDDAAVEVVRDWIDSIGSLGILVKGPWLIDFDSGAGHYCWRWPESTLRFFHGYDEGFSGRVPLQ